MSPIVHSFKTKVELCSELALWCSSTALSQRTSTLASLQPGHDDRKGFEIVFPIVSAWCVCSDQCKNGILSPFIPPGQSTSLGQLLAWPQSSKQINLPCFLLWIMEIRLVILVLCLLLSLHLCYFVPLCHWILSGSSSWTESPGSCVPKPNRLCKSFVCLGARSVECPLPIHPEKGEGLHLHWQLNVSAQSNVFNSASSVLARATWK